MVFPYIQIMLLYIPLAEVFHFYPKEISLQANLQKSLTKPKAEFLVYSFRSCKEHSSKLSRM